MNSRDRLKAYYERTAAHYDAMHVDPNDEHGKALAMFVEVARAAGTKSILDVGAGTGRALEILERDLPDVRLVGVEPSEALRAIGFSKGLAGNKLIDGCGEKLPFADGEFDFVIETGMLHHVPNPELVVAEMLRVAKHGIMISDSNKFAQGGRVLGFIKKVVDRLGLWKQMIWLQTFGRMAKWSEEDGVFYSYSVFDNLNQIRERFPQVWMRATVPMKGPSLRFHASHLCLIAMSVKDFYPLD